MKTIEQYRTVKNVENPSFEGLECKQVIDDLVNAFGRLHSIVGDMQGHSKTVVKFAMLDLQDALQHFDYQKNTLKK